MSVGLQKLHVLIMALEQEGPADLAVHKRYQTLYHYSLVNDNGLKCASGVD